MALWQDCRDNMYMSRAACRCTIDKNLHILPDIFTLELSASGIGRDALQIHACQGTIDATHRVQPPTHHLMNTASILYDFHS